MSRWFTGFPIVSASGRFSTSLLMVTPEGGSLRSNPYPRDMKHRSPSLPFEKACQYHKLADYIYQQKDEADIHYWRYKLKAPHMSTYDLWMKECLACFWKFGSSPSDASISGGYSTDHVIGGGHWIVPTAENIFYGDNLSDFINPSPV